jgi:peptidoglycan/xylan/chitin deacetylase (PgdA/CDA1 family)
VRRLNATRFGTAVQYCGSDKLPGTAVDPEWRVWTERETTPDQARIERHLPALIHRGSSILHIGVGNSGLAKGFSSTVNRIVGTTVDPEEKKHADDLAIPNYWVEIVNKYSSGMAAMEDVFDLIIDNNPASFSCCLFHLCRMMACYAELLNDDGVLVAAEPGLSWVVGNDTTWSLNWEDWVSFANALNLQPRKLDEFVYCMKRPGAADRSAFMSQVPILMYHSVSDEGPEELSRYRITSAAFAEQLQLLQREGYYSISVEEWATSILQGRMPTGRPVIITFDDGYKDFVTNAWPALLHADFTASVFVVTGSIGKAADWDSTSRTPLELMDWEDLRRIVADGGRIGSHCAEHRNLLDLSDELIAQDAGEARAAIARELGLDTAVVAFPWGLSDARTRNALARAGYKAGLAATGASSSLADDVMNLPRIEIFGEDDLDAFARKVLPARSLPPRPANIGRSQLREEVALEPALTSALAGRLGGLIDELVSMRSLLLSALAAPASLEKKLLALFTRPTLSEEATSVQAYAEISPGVWFGFQRTAQLSLRVLRKEEGVVSPDRFLNTVTAEFSGASTFFSLEATCSWPEICDATRFQLSLSAEPSRPVSCHAALRLPRRGGAYLDFAFARFSLQPGRRNVNTSGEINVSDVIDIDPGRTPLLLLFFDTTEPLTLRLDYLNAYFA